MVGGRIYGGGGEGGGEGEGKGGKGISAGNTEDGEVKGEE